MQIGPYSVLSELGRGAMGAVYRCRAPDGRDVAVKVVLEVAARDATKSARFEREQTLQASLGAAEGFVPLLDRGQSERGPYLVMPLLEGGTLRTRLKTGGAMPIDAAVELVLTLAHAVGRAHAMGVVHRDLKPENVLYDAAGNAYVGDLGIAKRYTTEPGGAGPGLSLSLPGEVRGTYGYLAPETLGGSKFARPAADVFALGAILHECLSGQPAFGGDTVHEVVARIAAGTREDLARLRPDTPRWLRAVVDRALATKPDERYPDAAALAAALEEGARAAPPSRALPIAAAALIGVLAVAAGALALRSREAVVPLPLPPAPPVTEPPPITEPAPPIPEPPPPPITEASPPATEPAPRTTEPRPVTERPVEVRPLAGPAGRIKTSKRLRVVQAIGSYEWKHINGVTDIHFGPGGRVFTASKDASARLWDEHGADLQSFRHGTAMRTGAFAADGTTVATAGDDGFIRLWDTASGRGLGRFEAHAAPITALAFLGSARLLSGCDDGSLALWHLAERRLERRFTGHEKAVIEVVPSKDGGRAFSASSDGTVIVWDLAGGALLERRQGRQAYDFAVSHDERLGLTVGADGLLALHDLAAAAGPAAAFRDDPQLLTAVAFLPGGPGERRALVCASDGSMREWDLDARRELRSLPIFSAFPPLTIALAPDERTVFIGTLDGLVRQLDLTTGVVEPRPRGHVLPIPVLALAAGGKTLLTSSNDRTLKAHDLATGRQLRGLRLQGSTGATFARRCAFARDGSRAFAACQDGTLRVLDLEQGREVARPVVAREKGLTDVAISPDGKLLLVAGVDGAIHRLEVDAKTAAAAWRTRASFATALTFIDDRTFVAGRDDGKLEVWEVGAKAPRQVLDGHATRVTCLEPLPGRRAVVAGSRDGGVSCWDLDAATCAWQAKALHATPINGLAASRDLVVSLGADSRACLLDVATGALAEELDLGTITDVPYDAAWLDERSFVLSTGRGVILRVQLLPR